jgi:hypothetical protein
MNPVRRLLVLACASIAAMAVAGSAIAAYTSPRLVVRNPSERLGGGGPLTIQVSQNRADTATARVTIYVPQGYVSSLVPQTGQTIGAITARAQALAISPDAVLDLQGSIIAADPTPYRTNPQSVGCAGNALFDSVWVLQLQAAGQTLNVPAYVTTVTNPPEANFASGKITICLPSPYVPVAQGGAQFGAKLLSASMTLRGIFTNPGTGGDYRWRALWTPYAENTATIDAAGSVETQSVDRLPAQLTLQRISYNRRTNRMVFGGTLREHRAAVGGAAIQILRGTTARNVKRVRTVRTVLRNGQYRVTLVAPRGRTFFVRARVTVPQRNTSCVATFTTPAPIPCIAANLSPFTIETNRVLRVQVPR